MTFKASGIVTLQRVLPIFFRKRYLISQHIKDFIQCLQLFRLIKKAFQILLELAGVPQFLHNPIDLSMASTLEVSIGPSSLPALASSKAA